MSPGKSYEIGLSVLQGLSIVAASLSDLKRSDAFVHAFHLLSHGALESDVLVSPQ